MQGEPLGYVAMQARAPLGMPLDHRDIEAATRQHHGHVGPHRAAADHDHLPAQQHLSRSHSHLPFMEWPAV